MAVPLVRIENLKRFFRVGNDVVRAVDGVDFAVDENSFTLLQGPSGSGKTTLMNLIGALDYPSEGSVWLGDVDICRLSEDKRDEIRRNDIGFVFQSVALIGLMSAIENVDFRLRISGFGPDQRRKRAAECLELVDLKQRMQHRPQELSGGEQQRVAIARAICNKPRIILADEPTGELDTKSGLRIVKLFRDLIEKEGVTLIMTSHDPNMAELADRVLLMEDGKIVQANAGAHR